MPTLDDALVPRRELLDRLAHVLRDVADVARAAEDELGISPEVTKKSLRTFVVMDGGIENSDEQLRQFFSMAFPPDKQPETTEAPDTFAVPGASALLPVKRV